MSIRLDVKEYCSVCREFEAHVDKNVLENFFGEVVDSETVVSCVNRHKCELLKKYLEKEKSNATETC